MTTLALGTRVQTHTTDPYYNGRGGIVSRIARGYPHVTLDYDGRPGAGHEVQFTYPELNEAR